MGPPRTKREDASGARLHGLYRRREIEEECTGGSQRIVTDRLDCEDDDSSRNDGSELTRVLQHLVVARYEPRIPQLMKGDDELAIAEIS